jgi:predicted SAM-dependent methyltransferase
MLRVLAGHYAALSRIVVRWPRFASFVEPLLAALHRELDWERADRDGRRVAVSMLHQRGPTRVELGSAHFRREGWISLDIADGADARVDLRRGLPFPDESVDEVHAEHVFEHLEYPSEIMPLLVEVHRVLVAGGMLSFSVPNFRPYASAYVTQDKAWLEERIYDRPAGLYDATELDLLSWFALRAGEHRYLYDPDNAMARLREAGFVDVGTREFDESRDYNPRASSVYVVGRKAGG